jgi:hypothetical protein
MGMNAKELAAKLDRSEYPLRIDKKLRAEAAESGLVIVYGQSDDLMEFDGAIYDEIGCYEGGTAFVDEAGLLPARDQIEGDEGLKRLFERMPKSQSIEAQWCNEGSYSWTYKTDGPHKTFDIVEDGENYCRGIVFSLEDIRKKL